MDSGAEVEEEGGGHSNVFGEAVTPPVTLNLTALMDILSKSTIFLLACFGATIVMAINASVPVASAHQSDLADTLQSVTVNVAMNAGGFDVSALGSAQKKADLDKLARKIPRQSGDFDYATLTQTLVNIKSDYPKSDTVIITPEAGLTYETMVKTMDAARETTTTIAGRSRVVALFPSVVISTVVK